ncbi:hypothetical protein PIB30_100160, partial [Stylosanthes scabra]|nr:hypothetical protein [Stylosanthes scabra]
GAGQGNDGTVTEASKTAHHEKNIIFLRRVSKEKRNAPLKRLDHKETRSSRNSEKRNPPCMHQNHRKMTEPPGKRPKNGS